MLAPIAVPKVSAEGGPLQLLYCNIETLAAKVLPRPQCRPRLQLGARRQIFLLRRPSFFPGWGKALPGTRKRASLALERVGRGEGPGARAACVGMLECALQQVEIREPTPTRALIPAVRLRGRSCLGTNPRISDERAPIAIDTLPRLYSV